MELSASGATYKEQKDMFLLAKNSKRWEDQMIAILHFIYTSGTIGKIHAVLYKLEKDGDTYISPEKKLLSELNNKEIKGPTLLSHKADPGRD